MKKRVSRILMVAVSILICACGDSHTKVIDDQVEIIDDLTEILIEVSEGKDPAEASAEVKKKMAEAGALAERAAKLGEPTRDDKDALEDEALEKVLAAMNRLQEAIAKLQKSGKATPELMDALGRGLDGM